MSTPQLSKHDQNFFKGSLVASRYGEPPMSLLPLQPLLLQGRVPIPPIFPIIPIYFFTSYIFLYLKKSPIYSYIFIFVKQIFWDNAFNSVSCCCFIVQHVRQVINQHLKLLNIYCIGQLLVFCVWDLTYIPFMKVLWE